jgi:colicin import membrane protein
MSERSAQAYVLSALLHAAVVALCVLFAYLTQVAAPPTQKVFELVAGEGSNYGATEAPALGSPDAAQVSISAPVLPPLPVPPQPAPPQPAPLEATPTPVAPVKPAPVRTKPVPPIPDFSRSVARTATRTESRIEAKEKRKAAAEAKRLAAQQKQITYDEYLKEHGQGIAGGVVGGSTANKVGGAGGKALTREEGSLMEAYYAFLEERLRESFVAPPDASDSLTVHVKFYVSANGSISNVELDRPSGNGAFDAAVLEAFHEIRAGVGVRPDKRSDSASLNFSLKPNDTP